MEEKKILYSKNDGVGIITLNRPEKMNAISDDMSELLINIIDDVILDNDVRAVVITGNGKAFCGGTDLSAGLSRERIEGVVERHRKAQRVDLPPSHLPTWTFTRIPKPTIAAVNGAAVGVGVEWTIQCDVRIASESARFGWVFPLRGITPDTGAGPYLLPCIVGLSKALELMYSGEIIDATEAERIGLVSRVVPQGQLLPAAMDLAIRLTRGAPLAIRGIKELTYGSLEWPPSIYYEENAKRLRSLIATEDAKEGVRSFMEKRTPLWKGK